MKSERLEQCPNHKEGCPDTCKHKHPHSFTQDCMTVACVPEYDRSGANCGPCAPVSRGAKS